MKFLISFCLFLLITNIQCDIPQKLFADLTAAQTYDNCESILSEGVGNCIRNSCSRFDCSDESRRTSCLISWDWMCCMEYLTYNQCSLSDFRSIEDALQNIQKNLESKNCTRLPRKSYRCRTVYS